MEPKAQNGQAPTAEEIAAKVVEETNVVRELLSDIALRIKNLEAIAKPPVVQELVLARRHAEDARYRLGYAGAFARGLDPLQHKFPDQGGKTNVTTA